MKIRDISKYLATYTKGSEIFQLGNPEDPFCKAVFAENFNLESHIEELSSFAVKGHEQFYYEFLQNAQDEGADTFCLFYDQNNLLIINNGLPFSTKREDNNSGELYSFLAKGKSDKPKRKDKIGSKGLGSKLLYDFLTEVNDQKKGVRLRSSLIDEKKGPIIFSWNSWDDIESLFDTKIEVASSAEDSFPLLTKLVYSYYPSMPGEIKKGFDGSEIELFSDRELSSFRDFVDQVFEQFKSLKNSLMRGTMFYVPLGSGQHEKLVGVDEEALALKLKVSGVLLKQIKQICIKGDYFDARTKAVFNVQEIPYIHQEKIETFRFVYPIDLSVNIKKIPNFFQRFPVTEEQHNLGFIFDSEGYDIDNGRQRVDLTQQNNKSELMALVEGLKAFLDKAKTEDPGTYFKIFGSIISSGESTKTGNGEFVNDNILRPLITYCKENVPTGNRYLSSEQVFHKNTPFTLNPIDVGLIDYFWIDERLRLFQDQLEKLDIESASISDLLERTKDERKAEKWICSLDANQYEALVSEIIKQRSGDSLREINFIKVSSGGVLCLNDILDSEEIILLTEEIKALASVFKKCGIIFSSIELLKNNTATEWIASEVDEDELLERIIRLLVSNQETLNSLDKCVIAKALTTAFSGSIEKIRSELGIFECINKSYEVPAKLLANSTFIAPSGILNQYQVIESELCDEVKAILMRKDEIWDHLMSDWADNLLPEIENGTSFKGNEPVIFKELENIYSLSKEVSDLPVGLRVIWTKKGFRAREDIYFVSELLELSDDEYEKCIGFLNRVTDFTGVSSHIRSSFLQSDFNPKKNNSISELRDKLKCANTNLNIHDVKHLVSLGRKNCDNVLQHFKLLEAGGDFELTERGAKEKIFFSKDDRLNNFIIEANQQNFPTKYYPFPKELLPLFSKTDKILINEEALVKSLVDDFGAQESFIDLLEGRSKELIIAYFNKVYQISLISESYYDGSSYEYKLLNLAARFDLDVKSKIFIDDQPLKNFLHAENIKVDVGDLVVEFRLSDLLLEYKGKSDVLVRLKNSFDAAHFVEKYFHAESENQGIVYETLKGRSIVNVHQLLYQISYDLAFLPSGVKCDLRQKDNYPLIPSLDVLNQLFRKGLNDFEKVFVFQDFGPKGLIFTENQELILPEEQLPSWVVEWLEEKHQKNEKNEKLEFLRKIGVQGSTSPVVNIRQRFWGDEDVQETSFKSFRKNTPLFFANTIKWASKTFLPIVEGSRTFYNLQALIRIAYLHDPRIDGLTLHQLYFLGFDLTKDKITFEFKPVSINDRRVTYYLEDDYEKAEQVLVDCVNKAGVELIYTAYTRENDELKSLLKDRGLQRAAFYKNVLDDKVSSKEWKATYYTEWLKEYADLYRIFTSEEDIPFDYEFRYGGSSVRKDNILSQAGGVIKGKPSKLFVRNKNNIPVLNALEENKTLFFGGKTKPLFDLYKLSAITDDQRNLLEILHLRGVTIEQLDKSFNGSRSHSTNETKQDSASNGDGNGSALDKKLSGGELEKLNKNLDSFLKIANELTDEEISQLAEGKKALRDVLEEAEPEANEVTGYLGEKIVQYYIKKLRSNYRIEHTAEETPEYDLVLLSEENKEIFIDVKTTLKPIQTSSKSIPFYIKDSQLRFIKSQKPENYFIFRLGLKELGLADIVQAYKGNLTAEAKDSLAEIAQKTVEEQLPLVKNSLLYFRIDQKSIMEAVSGQKEFIEG